MKYLSVFLLILIASCSGSDATRLSMSPGEGEYTFTDVHNKLKDASYDLVNEWIAKNYSNTKETIELKNKDTGTLILKALATCPLALSQIDVWYTLTIKTKDKAIKFEFVTGQTTNGFYPPENGMDDLQQQYIFIASSITDYINSSKEF